MCILGDQRQIKYRDGVVHPVGRECFYSFTGYIQYTYSFTLWSLHGVTVCTVVLSCAVSHETHRAVLERVYLIKVPCLVQLICRYAVAAFL